MSSNSYKELEVILNERCVHARRPRKRERTDGSNSDATYSTQSFVCRQNELSYWKRNRGREFTRCRRRRSTQRRGWSLPCVGPISWFVGGFETN